MKNTSGRIQKLLFEPLSFSGAYLIKPFVASDERGCFVKDYSQEVFAANGIQHDLKEVFYTYSARGVVRAIHFQRVKQQAKLVRCVSGAIFDVIVDLRRGSKHFGKWQGFSLTGSNMNQILVPEGFGHGYLVLEDAVVSYKCAEKFYSEYDDGIIWNDKDISIDWPLDGINQVILSEKDRNLPAMAEFIRSNDGGF